MNVSEANAVIVVLRRAGLLDEEISYDREVLAHHGVFDEQFRRSVELLAQRAARALMVPVLVVEDPAVVVPFRVPPGAPVVLPESDDEPEEEGQAA